MLPRNLTARLGVIVGLLNLGFMAMAQGEPFTSTNRPAIKSELRPGETVGDHQIQRAYVRFGTNLFVFVVPDGFTLNAADPEKIILSNPEGDCFITLRLARQTVQDPAADLKFCRETALQRFPGAELSTEFEEFALNRSGPAFDLKWRIGGAEQLARIIFISSPAGLLEFSLVTTPKKFSTGRRILVSVMAGLQSGPESTIVTTPALGCS
ncbi:MAG: hypothetical protein H7Y43_04605 [Akkermansiaceae bacterium]|nr:hypothetical protein [Verrucomicrobiales bacterium]